MRKIFLAAFLVIFALALAATTAKDEAVQSLQKAKDYIGKDDFVNARNELDYALSKISEIQAEILLTFIPEAPSGFTLDAKDSQVLGAAGAMVGSANSFMATGTYIKDDMSLKLTLTVGGMLGQTGGLMGLATMFGGGSTNGNTKSIRINGYTGNQEYDKEDLSGTLTIQVGSKITVMVEGTDIPSADFMKTIAEKVEMAKLEKAF
jgi:hypothetical protein